MCDTVNVQNGASLTVSSDSMGVEALTGGVNVTGGSMLTAGCEYGVYIIGGKLKVEEGSQLNTNSSVAPFCIVDTKAAKHKAKSSRCRAFQMELKLRLFRVPIAAMAIGVLYPQTAT